MDNVQRAQNIRQRFERRLEKWRAGSFAMLVQDTVCTSHTQITKTTHGMTEESIANTYSSLVFHGKIRAAVCFATERGEGGVLQMDSINANSKSKVFDVLHKKHPTPGHSQP